VPIFSHREQVGSCRRFEQRLTLALLASRRMACNGSPLDALGLPLKLTASPEVFIRQQCRREQSGVRRVRTRIA
jgi:hypothetical protein